MAHEEMIRLDGIGKRYGEGWVLRNFSLGVRHCEFLTVIGSSGCGKTTALKLMNGLLTPDEGRVFIDGIDVAQTDQIALRRRMGYVIQGVGLFPHMDVCRNIAYVPGLTHAWKKAERMQRAGALLETVGLERSLLNRYPSELSGGQRQRVGLARALAARPEILLMDEPFGAVDEITRHALQEQIKRIQKELRITIVFITHDIQEALKLGDRVLVMESGNCAQLGTPAELTSQPRTEFVKRLISGN